MRELPSTPVFDRSDARALGWSDPALTRAIAAGRVVRLRRGQYVDARLTAPARQTDRQPLRHDSIIDRERRSRAEAVAAANACRGSVISHRSAALIHGLPILQRAPFRPTLTVAPGGASRLAGAQLHRATLPAQDIVGHDQVLHTSVARTVVDLARESSTQAGVVALDYALHHQLTSAAQLEAVLRRCWNWPGINRAGRAVALGDARSESPLESVSRLVLSWLRLPPPQLQALICAADGGVVARADFYWDEFGVVGEADGAGKYELSPTSLIEEKRRQERMEDLGIVVVRWGWDDVITQPSQLRARIERAFERGGARSGSGLCRQWSVWRS